MSTKLAKIVADFTAQLTTQLSIGGTTATLSTATDDDAVALPAGIYFFTLDGANSSKEHIVATLSGTSLTAISSVSRQGAQASGAVRLHRVGATVTITDFAHILYMNNLLSGTTGFDATVPIKYDGSSTPTLGQYHIPTWDYVKAYADGLAVAGAPDSSTSTKGIGKLTSAPATNLGNPTITIASPAVVTLNAHGLIAGDTVQFTTTGALPTGITASTNYYVIAGGLTANAFEISATSGGSAINTSGSQSGTHTLLRTTPFFVGNDDTRLPTQALRDAMAGSLGTPSSSNPFVTQQELRTVTAMGAQAIDGTLGSIFTRTLAGNETFTQSGFTVGRTFLVEVKQGAGTAYTATWFTGITWVTFGGTAPVQTTVTNGITTYAFRCTGANTFLGYLAATQ